MPFMPSLSLHGSEVTDWGESRFSTCVIIRWFSVSAFMAMNCPKCHSAEIDSAGFCLVCGLRAFVSEQLPPTEDAGRLEGNSTDAAQSARQTELPEWRLELSRRLQEIKSRREVGEVSPGETGDALAPEVAAQQPRAGASESEVSRPAGPKRPRRPPRMIDRDLAPAIPPDPVPDSSSPGNTPAVREPQIPQELPQAASAGDIVIRPSSGQMGPGNQRYTQELIDTAVAKIAVRGQTPAHWPEPEPGSASVSKKESKAGGDQMTMPAPRQEDLPVRSSAPIPEVRVEERKERFHAPIPEFRSAARAQIKEEPKVVLRLEPMTEEPKVEPTPVLVALQESAASPAPADEPHDAKLILLSRTLAGLVDFIIVVICAGLMIVTVDVLEGIEIFDTVSKLYYGLLFLVIYFVYSVFFLGMAGQTIGMMLTDLRLTDASIGRPAISRILIRCCAFLLSLTIAGLGLMWGFFDSQARCLHDRLSHTRVVRVSPD